MPSRNQPASRIHSRIKLLLVSLFWPPSSSPCLCLVTAAELGTAGRTWRQCWGMQREKWEGKERETVAAWVCFTMTPCKLPLTGTPSALLAKERCDNSFNYWHLADQYLHMDCVNIWGYIKLTTCNRFNCCTGSMSSAYLWKHSSSPHPTLPFILKT